MDYGVPVDKVRGGRGEGGKDVYEEGEDVYEEEGGKGDGENEAKRMCNSNPIAGSGMYGNYPGGVYT